MPRVNHPARGAFTAALLLAGLAAPAAAQAATPVRITELHYDNAGTDAGEAIEVSGPAGTDLSGLSLVLYNGNGGASYGTRALTGTIPDEAGGRGAVAVTYPANGIQNGDPDAVALVEGTEVVELLSYGGTFTAANGPAAGRTTTDIGVKESSTTPAGQSLQLVDGAWTGPATSSFGTLNAGTVVEPPAEPSATCADPATSIPAIQGTGAQSTRVGERVAIEGVVVGDFQGTPAGLGGVFVQDPAGDGDPATSDGIFVFGANRPDVAAGDRVRVLGTVAEFARSSDTSGRTLTQLASASDLTVCEAAGPLPQPAVVALPADRDVLEQVEGMRVVFPQPLALTESYQLDDFGQAVLSSGGVLDTPTEVAEPGAPAQAVAAENARRSIVLDDGSSRSRPRPVPYLGDPADPTRRGDQTSGLTGVLSYDHGAYRVNPTAPVVFDDAGGERPSTPGSISGDVRIGDANVLNYFTTLGRRGAETPEQLARQRTKTVNALSRLNADVVALQEVESNDGVALQDLVDALNRKLGAGTYAGVPVPENFSGTDEITVAMVYKPSRLVRISGSLALTDPVYSPGRQPIAQTFQGPGGERFTVIANHFKSKGCGDATGADADQGDGQGCWNATRVAQAERLADWADELRDLRDDDDVVLVGDLNAYGKEDPIDVLRGRGYVDQLEAKLPVEQRWSYVFDGGQGALDHILTSPGFSPQVRGANVVHFNAPEADALSYFGVPEYFSVQPRRSSDHDPAIIGVKTSTWKPRCQGREVTKRGTDGPDTITGTAGRDVIDARGGDDLVLGLDGSDFVCGGEGQDQAEGGDGFDLCQDVEVRSSCRAVTEM